MKYYIYNKSNKELAVINVDDKGFYDVEFRDKEFESFLNLKIAEGIKVFDEKYEENSFLVVTKTVSKDDKNIGHAILEFLRYNGYVVSKDTKDIKKEIEIILTSFPNNDSKKEMLEMLPNLTYLEATLLVRELQAK